MSRHRRKTKRTARVLFFVMLLIFGGTGIFLYVVKHQTPKPTGTLLTSYVMDEAEILQPDERARIAARLADLDHSGGPQIVVATEAHLQGATIADDGIEHARRWRIGHAGRNDGALLLIVQSEHKARIEVGYGLEGVLTDAATRILIDRRMEAHLRAGEWTDAAREGVDGMISIVRSEPAAAQPDAVRPTDEATSPPPATPSYTPSIETQPSFLHDLGQLAGILLFLTVFLLVGLGFIQAIVLSIPGVDKRLVQSKHWSWIARWRVLGSSGGSSRSDSDSGSSSSSSSDSGSSDGGSIGGGGDFGGGGSND